MVRRKPYWFRYRGWYDKQENMIDLSEIGLIRTSQDADGDMRTELCPYGSKEPIATIWHNSNKKGILELFAYFAKLRGEN